MTDRGTELPRGTEEEDATVRLLRAAGQRTPVSPQRAARVRSAVRTAWQTDRRRLAIRRRIVIINALAGAAALVVFAARVVLPDRDTASFGEPVAVVEAVDGTATEIQHAKTIRVGEWIETGEDSRVALRFGRERSVRLDVGSRVRALSPSVVELSSGAVYVDSGHEEGGFEIRTALGDARDIGTQFEVRLVDRSLRLRVRTGIVEIRSREHSIVGRPGTEIVLSATGAVTRPISPYSAEWEWANRVAPLPEMDGMPLATFLERVAHEQGWSIEYGDAALAREAATIVLHGSVGDLSPDEAVEVAITTSGLRHRLRDGSLVVFRASAPEADEGSDLR